MVFERRIYQALTVACLAGVLAAPSIQAQSVLEEQALKAVTAAKTEIVRIRNEIAALEAEVARREAGFDAALSQGDTAEDVEREITELERQVSLNGFFQDLSSTCRGRMIDPSGSGGVAAANDCLSQVRLRVPLPETFECSSLAFVTQGPEAIRLEGYVSSTDDLAELIAQYGPRTASTIEVRPWPVCAALDALELPLTAVEKPRVRMLARQTMFRFGDSLAFEVRTPSFPSFVYAAYLGANGKVENLTPRGGPLRKQEPPNAILRFGDGLEGRPTYTASEPAGPEAIIVIAARSPIDQLEEIEVGQFGEYIQDNGQKIDRASYIGLLEKGLADVPDRSQSGRDIAANLIHIEVVEN